MSLAIITYLSKDKRAELSETLANMVKTASEKYLEVVSHNYPSIAEKAENKTLVRGEYFGEYGTTIAGKRHLQLLKQLSPDIALDMALLNQVEEALDDYQKKLQALDPQFPKLKLGIDQQLEETDTAQLATELSPKGPMILESLPFEPPALYSVGLCTGVDCLLIGLDLKPYLKLQELRNRPNDEDSVDLKQQVQTMIQTAIEEMLAIATYTGNVDLTTAAGEIATRFKEVIEEPQGPELLDEWLKLEQQRILTLFSQYLKQPQNIIPAGNKSLSDIYLDPTDWTTFWKKLGQ